jgi:hypothetical protein
VKLGSSGAFFFPVSSILPIICTFLPPLVLHSEIRSILIQVQASTQLCARTRSYSLTR